MKILQCYPMWKWISESVSLCVCLVSTISEQIWHQRPLWLKNRLTGFCWSNVRVTVTLCLIDSYERDVSGKLWGNWRSNLLDFGGQWSLRSMKVFFLTNPPYFIVDKNYVDCMGWTHANAVYISQVRASFRQHPYSLFKLCVNYCCYNVWPVSYSIYYHYSIHTGMKIKTQASFVHPITASVMSPFASIQV